MCPVSVREGDPPAEGNVPTERVRLPEIPHVGDILSFEELSVEAGRYPTFQVSGRYYHLRHGHFAVATLKLIALGEEVQVEPAS